MKQIFSRCYLLFSIERLETLLDEHRRRETEEASSLERSMEQIESNLKIATVHNSSQLKNISITSILYFQYSNGLYNQKTKLFS